MASKLYGENGKQLVTTITGTSMIAKAYADSIVNVSGPWGADGEQITLSNVDLPNQGTIEGATSVTLVSGTVIVYK